jgi:hypothetical protein
MTAPGAIKARLDVERRARARRRSALDLAADFRRLAVRDGRDPNEVMGYDDNGLPH